MAPARHVSGNGRYQRRSNPLASITSPPPAVKAALSFWPALNLPVGEPARVWRRRGCSWNMTRSHFRSAGVHLLKRRMSRRSAWPQRTGQSEDERHGEGDAGIEVYSFDQLAAAHESNQGRQVKSGASEDEHRKKDGIRPVDGPLDPVEAGQQATAITSRRRHSPRRIWGGCLNEEGGWPAIQALTG